MPSLLVAKEARSRMARYVVSTGTLIFNANDPVSESRTMYGQTFKFDQGKWTAFTAVDRTAEISRIITASPLPTIPYQGLSLADTQMMFPRMIQTSMVQFWNPKTAYFANGTAAELANFTRNTQNPVSHVVQSNWPLEISDMWNNPSYGIGPLVIDFTTSEAEINKKAALDALTRDSVLSNNVLNVISGGVSLAASFVSLHADNAINNGKFMFEWINTNTRAQNAVKAYTGILAVATFTMTLVAVGFQIAMWANSDDWSTDRQKSVNRQITYATVTLKLISGIVSLGFAIKTATAVTSVASEAVKGGATLFNGFAAGAKIATKAATALMVVGVLVSVGMAWATAGIAIKSAKYGYQIGNAVATAIGATLAVIALAIIGDIPIIGWIITAIIAVIDAIATAACTTVSAINARKTGYKLACGGISGALTNALTMYASNVVVDMDDSYSFNRDVSDVSHFVHTNQGYVQHNEWDFSLNINDSIAKMPMPSAWQSIAYGWMWNDEDIRNTSRAYKLGSSDQDLRSTIDIGTNFGNWVTSTTVTTDTDNAYINFD
ncbi:MAG: hypothetical protein NT020_09450, partial [Chloroflexales bacterium]|nr:hypothetical protein [Chloroflexales bacterium]